MAIERGVDDIDVDELGIEDNSKEVIGRREKKMTDREMEKMLDEIFRKVFKEDW